MPEVETWWRHVRESAADLDGHPPYELVSRVCAADEEVAAGTIVRGALRESARGWSGPFVEASTRKIMTFYPGAPGTCGTAFSRQKCHETRAAIKPSSAPPRLCGMRAVCVSSRQPANIYKCLLVFSHRRNARPRSLEFYTWLVACGSEWQLRGDLELSAASVGSEGWFVCVCRGERRFKPLSRFITPPSIVSRAQDPAERERETIAGRGPPPPPPPSRKKKKKKKNPKNAKSPKTSENAMVRLHFWTHTHAGCRTTSALRSLSLSLSPRCVRACVWRGSVVASLERETQARRGARRRAAQTSARDVGLALGRRGRHADTAALRRRARGQRDPSRPRILAISRTHTRQKERKRGGKRVSRTRWNEPRAQLIFQLSGEKKFFLCSRAAVRAARRPACASFFPAPREIEKGRDTTFTRPTPDFPERIRRPSTRPNSREPCSTRAAPSASASTAPSRRCTASTNPSRAVRSLSLPQNGV